MQKTIGRWWATTAGNDGDVQLSTAGSISHVFAVAAAKLLAGDSVLVPIQLAVSVLKGSHSLLAGLEGRAALGHGGT